MTHLSKILIIVPDRGFRRSIEFALEVEGYKAVSFSTMDAASDEIQASKADCAVIDETALKNDSASWNTLRHVPIPVIMLVDRAHPFPEASFVRFLIKPVFGNALITEIRKLTGDKPDPSDTSLRENP
ncbi:hypothetical protein [Phyllobacterium myrsinacearum]|uniref:DNA-binding response OmpR family regulator n=1 Tax=Phyllobacterium myrsinacearum TaxID=28101 RepID=A0A839EX32_9HYPH|nr:hypothetical protein [Phyllobacterium myrsinacearum]MBA8882084.1 DNA-binding response OmpR family regulator [Phyllobacterium myrsinacearum]